MYKIIKMMRHTVLNNKNTINYKKILKSVAYTISNLPLIIRLYRFSPNMVIKDILIFEISNSLVILILGYMKIMNNG